MTDDFYVYAHFDDKGECRYVGKGRKQRAWTFSRTMRSGLWKEFFKDKKPRVELLEKDLEQQEALEMESSYIEKFLKEGHGLLNLESGNGNRKWVKTDATRAYIDKIRSGKNHWGYGKKRPEETREKIELTKALNPQVPPRLGIRHTQETKDKISASNMGKTSYWLGKKRNPESVAKSAAANKKRYAKMTKEERARPDWVKQKISEAKKGRSNGLEGKKFSEETKSKMSSARKRAWENGSYAGPSPRAKPVRCIELNKVFPSATAAAKELDCMRSKISSCCAGNRKTHNGYSWEYAE